VNFSYLFVTRAAACDFPFYTLCTFPSYCPAGSKDTGVKILTTDPWRGRIKGGGKGAMAPRCQTLCNMTLKKTILMCTAIRKRHQLHQIMPFIFTWP